MKSPNKRFATMDEKELLEKLSELEHIQWEKWTRTLAHRLEQWCNDDWSKLTFEDNVADQIMKWKFNWKPYSQLQDDIKEYDREYARKVLELLKDANLLTLPTAIPTGEFNKDLEVLASPTPKESQKAIPSLNPDIKLNSQVLLQSRQLD